MFDVGFWELAMVGLIALIVLGPERLPKAARTAGLWVNRARRMIADVKADIDREVRASELEDVRKIGQELKRAGSDFSNEIKSGASALTRDVESTSPAADSVPASAPVEPPKAATATDGGPSSRTDA